MEQEHRGYLHIFRSPARNPASLKAKCLEKYAIFFSLYEIETRNCFSCLQFRVLGSNWRLKEREKCFMIKL